MFSQPSQILRQHFSPLDTLVLALSGGPDSTALLDVLVNFSRSRQPAAERSLRLSSVIVAHVNHGIRGKEADRDEAFVRGLAKKYKLKCEVKRVNLEGKAGQEELGRAVRREFFEKLRQKYKARWILTAHTEDDQLETIVFNFLRGSGPSGLAGMKVADGHFLKPFLQTPKSEIFAHLKSRKLAYCRDSTNVDMRYRRNFIRKKILPLFAKVNPEFRKTLIRNSEIFRDIENWLESEAGKFLRSSGSGVIAKKFLSLPSAVQSAALQLMFQSFSKQPYRLSSVKIGEIRRLLGRGIGRKKIELKKGMWLSLQKGKFEIRACVHRS